MHRIFVQNNPRLIHFSRIGRFLIVIGLGILPSLFIPSLLLPSLNAQATLVVDAQHNATSVIESATSGASTALKRFLENPAWEKISKVQDWLKKASAIVSNVIKNMKMTRQLIELETEMWEILTTTLSHYNQLDYWPTKWLHRKLIIDLWYEKVRIFEAFDLAIQQNQSIMDDEGRIELIKDALQQARRTKAAMKVVLRRSNRDIATYRRAQKEIDFFKTLFK